MRTTIGVVATAASASDEYGSPQPPRFLLLQLQVKVNDAAVVATVGATTAALAPSGESTPAPDSVASPQPQNRPQLLFQAKENDAAVMIAGRISAAPGPDVYGLPQPPRPQLLQLQVKGNDAAGVAAVRTTTGAVATASSAPAP